MAQSESNLAFFSAFVIRTPAFPIDFYIGLTENGTIESDSLKKIVREPRINEALFLASPELSNEIKKWCSDEDYPAAKADKIMFSVLKYLIRMSTRCTPFGLFAACGTGIFSDSTDIKIHSPLQNGNSSIEKKSFYRRTRLDMQFLDNLSQMLSKDQDVQNKLLFSPNTTLYRSGDFYRYVGYSLLNGKRKYYLEAVRKSSHLDLIMQKASVGCKKKELASCLVNDEISGEEALDFIDELISSQILVSKLAPALSGNDHLFDGKIKKATQSSPIDKFLPPLDKVKNQLHNIDLKSANSISSYREMIDALSVTMPDLDRKYLFQTDLFLKSDNFRLHKKYKYDISKAIFFLNKISSQPKNTMLENFKKSFIKRYDQQSVPLVRALDIETGIGYLQNNAGDYSPLLDSIAIKPKKASNANLIELSASEKILYDRIQNAFQKNLSTISVDYHDFQKVDLLLKNMPETYSCVFEIVQEAEKEWISIQSIGGSSAANLLARFCYGNDRINNLAHEVINHESYSLSDKIIAEIIHLPESRTGNVLRRPCFRDYEIPYLAKSDLDPASQIPVEDLFLSVKGERLVLWSKKHDKEVIPRLTNAHNYSYNALPIYHLLCDLQFENSAVSIGISSKFEKLFDYLPRIHTENCILSKAKWIFKKDGAPELFAFLKKEFNLNLFQSLLPINLAKARFVSLIDGDNTLLIDLQNETCVRMLVETIKNRTHFILEEYLFPSKKLTAEGDYYANQFIACIKKSELIL